MWQHIVNFVFIMVFVLVFHFAASFSSLALFLLWFDVIDINKMSVFMNKHPDADVCVCVCASHTHEIRLCGVRSYKIVIIKTEKLNGS